MKIEGAGEIEGWRIAYDVDRFRDDGCNGRDLWSDGFGEEVVLLSSSDGSAYVCPEDPEAPWRLYVDPTGNETSLFGVPNEMEERLMRFGRWPSFGEVVACGVEQGALAADAGEALLSSSGISSEKLFTELLDGTSLELGAWELVFSKGGVRLSGPETTFEVGGGVALRKRQWQELVTSAGASPVTRTERMLAGDKDIDEAIGLLLPRYVGTQGRQQSVVAATMLIFEGARTHAQAIVAFEERCREVR